MEVRLPALPASDEKSFETNRFDYNYKRSSRGFWEGAEVIRIEDKPMTKCDHEFTQYKHEARCSKCNFGLIGFFEIRNGKLFYEGEPIGI